MSHIITKISVQVVLFLCALSLLATPITMAKFKMPTGAVIRKIELNAQGNRVMAVYKLHSQVVLQVNDSTLRVADDIQSENFSSDGQHIWYSSTIGETQYLNLDSDWYDSCDPSGVWAPNPEWKSKARLPFVCYPYYHCFHCTSQTGRWTNSWPMKYWPKGVHQSDVTVTVKKDTLTGKYYVIFGDNQLGPYDFAERFDSCSTFLYGVRDSIVSTPDEVVYHWYLRTVDSLYTGPICSNVPFTASSWDDNRYGFLYNVGGKQVDTRTYDCAGGAWYVKTRDSTYGSYQQVRRDRIGIDPLHRFGTWMYFGENGQGLERYGFGIQDSGETRLVTNAGTVVLGKVDQLWHVGFSSKKQASFLYAQGREVYAQLDTIIFGPLDWTAGLLHGFFPYIKFSENGLTKWLLYTKKARWVNGNMTKGKWYLWLNGKEYGPWKAIHEPSVHACDDGSAFVMAIPQKHILMAMGKGSVQDRDVMNLFVDGRTYGAFPDNQFNYVITAKGEVFVAFFKDNEIVIQRIKDALPQ